MSLVTVLRSPLSENTSVSTDSEAEEEAEDEEDGSLRSRTSSFEGFFASKSAAFSIPDGDFARKASKHGGEMQVHLQSMVNLLRDDDVLRLVVKLETKYEFPGKVRYLAVVSSFSLEDIEESIALGIDWMNEKVSVGLVVPLWKDTAIELDGDGGFELSSNYRLHILKPVSVQTMWTAFQWIHKCSDNARRNNHYPGGLSHGWAKYYENLVSSDQLCIKEWHETEDNLKVADHSIGRSKEDEILMKLIRHKLREVMMKVDLEEVTSKQVRESLEGEMQMDLREYKQFIDKEMLTIFGQMDSASKIYDHVYLGSEWNASNLEELKENGVGYILNITKEIDNFFAGTFTYLNIRLWDEEESNLLPYWDEASKFINQARDNGSKVLVHCKMGISRSASTVIAYGMKEYGTSLNDTMKYVKSRRACAQPNQGFWKQLITYEGILNSSRHRYNELFNRRRSSTDKDTGRSKRRRKRGGRSKASTLTTSKIIEDNIILEQPKPNTIDRSVFLDDIGQSSDEEEESELGDYDDDMSDDDEPLMMRPIDQNERHEEELQSWEDEMVGSSKSSPEQSPCSSRGHSDNEKENIDIEESENYGPKKPLHRAMSSPSLRKPPKKRKVHKKTLDGTELDRCHSLRELLTGRVAAVKEGMKANKLARTSGLQYEKAGSLERAEILPAHKDSSEDSDHTTGDTNRKSDEPSDTREESSSDGALAKPTEDLQLKAEPADVGSEPDSQQADDTHGLCAVKTGTVKRQSKNFEEGIVNIPWELEEIVGVAKKKIQEKEEPLSPETQGVLSEDAPTSGDEPLPGVVKRHTDALEKRHSKKSESEDDTKIDNVTTDTTAPKKLIIPESSFTVEIVGKTSEAEQGLLGIFDTGVVRRQINEEMRKEKIQRRISGSKKFRESTEEVIITKEEEEIRSSEKVETECTGEGSGGEEPLKGIVKRHAKDFEELHSRLQSEKSPKSPTSDGETGKKGPSSPQKVQTEAEAVATPKSGIPFKERLREQQGTAAYVGKQTIDVDKMLERANDEMKKHKSQPEASHKEEEFSTRSLYEDEKTESEETGTAEVEDEISEIPRPGTVKRNTELLMSRASSVPEQDEKVNESKRMSSSKEEVTDYKSESSVIVTTAEPDLYLEFQKDSVDPKRVREQSEEVGLVKRQTLILEGKYQEEPTKEKAVGITGDQEIPDSKSLPSNEAESPEAICGSQSGRAPDGLPLEIITLTTAEAPSEGLSSSGTVKKQKRLFEERRAVKDKSSTKDVKSESVSSKKEDISILESEATREPVIESTVDNKEPNDSVDTSSVVSVRFHLKLLEEIISSSNKREQHKQRTSKALAAIEEKRSQIDLARNKEDSRIQLELDIKEKDDTNRGNTMPEDLDDNVFACSSSSDEESEHDNLLNSLSDSAVSTALENAKKELDSPDETPPANSGHVKRRTLLLEEQIRETTTSVRRHVSMPMSLQQGERPVVHIRKRSLSDITPGSTSRTNEDLESFQPLEMPQDYPPTGVESPTKEQSLRCQVLDFSANSTVTDIRNAPPESTIKDREVLEHDEKQTDTDTSEYQRPNVKQAVQRLDSNA